MLWNLLLVFAALLTIAAVVIAWTLLGSEEDPHERDDRPPGQS